MTNKENGINFDEIVINHHANKIVEEIEDKNRMLRCGCPQCLKQVDAITEQHEQEAYAWNNPPEIDHEEMILYLEALSKLNYLDDE